MDERPFRIAIIGSGEAECREIERALQNTRYCLDLCITAPGEIFGYGGAKAELYVLVLPEDMEVSPSAPKEGATRFCRRTLFVTSNRSGGMLLWAFRQGAVDVLVRPFSEAELRIRVERLIELDPARFRHLCNEESRVEFLREMVRSGTDSILPALEASAPLGHFYPEVADSFGRTGAGADFLERLTDVGLLNRKLFNRIRLCSVCSSYHINYRETCPHCASIDVRREDVIHHFACGHMACIAEFRSGSDLICQKCHKQIRHIGLDYEKVTQQYTCSGCSEVFAESEVQAQCLWCGFVTEPSKTVERLIYSYELTDLARQAAKEGRIGGLDLPTLLHNQQTGLFSRQYFEHELQREMIRARRYEVPFSLLLVRVTDFEHIREDHEAEAFDYLNDIVKAVGAGLRKLDTACAWDTALLGVILSETSAEGAEIVADRMKGRVEALEHLCSIHEPRISITVVPFSENFDGPSQMMAAESREPDEQ